MTDVHHIADLGLEPRGFDGGDYVVTLDVAPRHLNVGGIVHGGVLCSLLDTAMARAVFMADGSTDLSSATLEMKVNFLAKAREEALVARGRVVQRTRRTAYVEGEIHADDRLVARASATMIVLD